MKYFCSFFQLIIYINISKIQLLIISISSNNKEMTIVNKNKRNLQTKNVIDNIVVINNISGNEAYVSSSQNQNGDIYLISNSEDPTSSNRVIYLIKSNYSFDTKTFTTVSTVHNKYPLMAVIKIEDDNKEYLATFSHEGSQFELLSYNSGKMFTSSLSIVNSGNSFISKNTFMGLKLFDNKNYILSAFVDKSNSYFMIHKLYYQRPDISMYHIENEEKSLFQAFQNSSVTCFEMGDFIGCLYINAESFYAASFFDISSLNLLLTEIIEENIINFGELFNKCIYFKNNVGAFIYFYTRNSFPKMQLKILDITENEYKLSNYTDSININSKSIFPLNYHYIYNDIIKTTDNNIFYLSTKKTGIEIYIILFKFINDDKNIIIKYYTAKINDVNNTAVYKDIAIFSFKGLLGIGMSNYNYNDGFNTTISSFFIIGYLTSDSNDNNINISKEINIFNEENNYKIKVNDIINNAKISNNIFNYLIAGIKIISDLNESNLGFYIYSNKTENKVEQNELITANDVINFKVVSDKGVKLGNYSIECEIIIKEPEYDDLISETVEYYPMSDISDDINLKEIFKPDYFSTRKSIIYSSVNECYKTCESCRYYGDDSNHHCNICSESYPFSLSIINGKNCYGECPENYKLIDDNICLKNTDLISDKITEQITEKITTVINDTFAEITIEKEAEDNSEEKIESNSEENTELKNEFITYSIFEKEKMNIKQN